MGESGMALNMRLAATAENGPAICLRRLTLPIIEQDHNTGDTCMCGGCILARVFQKVTVIRGRQSGTIDHKKMRSGDVLLGVNGKPAVIH